MKRSVWILLGVVLLAGLAAWLVLRPTTENVAIDFVTDFAKASEARPEGAFSVVDATLAGQTKRAIAVKQASRIAWSITVPNNAWLQLSAGLTEDSWTVAGDGVLFRVSVNDDELLNVVINPNGDPSARRWQDFALDLSEFAGENVKIFLKTNASIPGKNDTAGDSAVWGNPRIVTK